MKFNQGHLVGSDPSGYAKALTHMKQETALSMNMKY